MMRAVCICVHIQHTCHRVVQTGARAQVKTSPLSTSDPPPPYSPLQSSPERYEELTSQARKEYEAMQQRFGKDALSAQAILPFLGLANMVLMGTQFVAVQGLAGEAVGGAP